MGLCKDKSKILFVQFQRTKNANPFIAIQNKKLANPRLLNKLLLFPQGDLIITLSNINKVGPVMGTVG